MTSPKDGSRMMPSLAARAAFSPAPIISPGAVMQSDRNQRRAQKLTLGRRVSADGRRTSGAGAGVGVGVGAGTGTGTAGARRPSSPRRHADERTPLLPPAPSAPAVAGVDTYDAECSRPEMQRRASAATTRGRYHGLPGMNRPATIWNELRVLVSTCVPLSAGLMLENALNTINILVCGRLGASELAVAGNSSLLVMVTGYPIPLAVAAAFTTISAPLYSQPEARHHIGHWLQRTVLLSLALSLPIMLAWWNITPVLLKLKQPPELVEGMKWYLRAAVFVLPALSLVESMKSYLQVQGIMSPPPLILLALLPFHGFMAVYLVHYTSLGAPGAAISTTLTLTIAGLFLVVYALKTKARECWDGLSKRAFIDWSPLVWLAIPGALMFGSELWAFEIIALLAGRLGEVAVAAQAVISTLDNLVAMVPYAISIGIANRVGNLLGHGSRGIPRARRTVSAGFILEVAVAGSTGLALLIWRYQIADIFTDNHEVAREAAEAAVFVASYQVFDGLQNVGAACLRAFGRQNIGSIIHFVGYYIVGLPIGAWLGLGSPGWGLAGLWAGAALALACTSAAELLFAYTIKWEDEVERVQLREEDQSSSEESDDDDDDDDNNNAV